MPGPTSTSHGLVEEGASFPELGIAATAASSALPLAVGLGVSSGFFTAHTSWVCAGQFAVPRIAFSMNTAIWSRVTGVPGQ